MSSKKISAYIQLYYDLDFLEDILKGINKYVDEIIIVDGPFKYCVNFLNSVNLFYDENNKPEKLKNIIYNNNKIKYFYNIWENEKEKRIFGYSQCTNDIILLVDADEFFVFDIEAINLFIKSDKYVSGFKINNMNRINVNIEKETIKYIMFKKKKINALQHLSYTWLIGVSDLEPKNINYMNITFQMGTIYHQTLNRNKFNNIIKFIFYTRLHHYINNTPLNNIFSYDINQLLENINCDDLLNIFYHSASEFIGMPQNKNLFINENISIDLSKYENNWKDGYFTQNMNLLTNVNCFFYYDIENSFIIETENILKLNVEIIELCLDTSYNIFTFNNLTPKNDIVEINFLKSSNKNIGYVVNVKCTYTIDNSIYSKIKNIVNIHSLAFINDNNKILKIPYYFKDENNNDYKWFNCFLNKNHIINNEKKLRNIFIELINLNLIDINKNIIDGGCFIGDNSLLWAQNINGIVYAIDPSQNNNNLINYLCKINDINNIKFIQSVLTDLNDKEVSYSGSIDFNSFIYSNGQSKIKSTSLDTLYNNNIISNISFIHIDVEGFEYQVLMGSEKLIKDNMPIIVFEMHIKTDEYRYDIINLMHSYDFEIFIINEVSGARSDCRNFLAIPFHLQTQFKKLFTLNDYITKINNLDEYIC